MTRWRSRIGHRRGGTRFVINYRFGQPGRQPWDYWLQCLAENQYDKLPLTRFCRDVLLQVGVPESARHVFPFGSSPEVHDVEPPARSGGWLGPEVGTLTAHAGELTRQLGGPATRGAPLHSPERRVGLRGKVFRTLRTADLHLQRTLRERGLAAWLATYLHIRRRLKRVL